MRDLEKMQPRPQHELRAGNGPRSAPKIGLRVASARTAVKEPSPLRGAPLVPRSASLTASSLRLQSFYGERALPASLNESWMIATGGKLVET